MTTAGGSGDPFGGLGPLGGYPAAPSEGLPAGADGPIDRDRRIIDIVAKAISVHPAAAGFAERQCRDVAQSAVWALENNKCEIADTPK